MNYIISDVDNCILHFTDGFSKFSKCKKIVKNPKTYDYGIHDDDFFKSELNKFYISEEFSKMRKFTNVKKYMKQLTDDGNTIILATAAKKIVEKKRKQQLKTLSFDDILYFTHNSKATFVLNECPDYFIEDCPTIIERVIERDKYGIQIIMPIWNYNKYLLEKYPNIIGLEVSSFWENVYKNVGY